MNGVLGHIFCAYIGLAGPGKPPKNDMTCHLYTGLKIRPLAV